MLVHLKRYLRRMAVKVFYPLSNRCRSCTSCEAEGGLDSMISGNIIHNRMDAIGGREYCDVNLAKHAERNLNIDDSHQTGRTELVDYKRARISVVSEVLEMNPTNYVDRGQSDHVRGKFAGSESHTLMHFEPSERSKLELLPRTRPVESLESPAADHAQDYQLATQSGHDENCNELHVKRNPSKPGLASTESGNQAQERPKLNLKPRSQPHEQLEANVERGRNSLFVDARQRHLVLKERGVNDTGVVRNSEKVEYHVQSERVSGHTNAAHYSDKKRSERRDHRVDTERRREHSVGKVKVDMQRRNWRNENVKNRENERQHQQ